jgi:hypothetical protein
MLRQFLVGGAVSACNVAIHAVVTAVLVRAAQAMAARTVSWPSLRLTGVMMATFAYLITNAAPADADLVYFAFVNYTTLGYGDITPVARWRLLGPMTAMNGVLLFGWSTAVIFEVLLKTTAAAGGGDFFESRKMSSAQ